MVCCAEERQAVGVVVFNGGSFGYTTWKARACMSRFRLISASRRQKRINRSDSSIRSDRGERYKMLRWFLAFHLSFIKNTVRIPPRSVPYPPTTMNNALSTANLHDMPQLPFELVLEIAAFCAGSFNFKTFLALALICRQAHTCLKAVLARPILVITELDFDSGIIHRINEEQIEDGRVPEKWRNMQ
jgi:hypothetical protein